MPRKKKKKLPRPWDVQIGACPIRNRMKLTNG